MQQETMDATVWTRSSELLVKLNSDQLHWLLERATAKVKNKGEHVFYPQDTADTLYFVESGKLKVGSFAQDGRETIRCIAQAGDLIGESALRGEHLRSEFATSLEDDAVIHAVNVGDIHTLALTTPEFALQLISSLSGMIDNSRNRCESIIFKDARSRIVDAIRDMGSRHGQVLAGGSVLITHSLTHQDFASLTATSRQTVTTVFNELKDAELINFDRKTILIHEPEKLH